MAMFCRSIEYSFAAFIMDGRQQLPPHTPKSGLKLLDKRIKKIYDLSLSIYLTKKFDTVKTHIIPSSGSPEAGFSSTKKCSFDCQELSQEILAIDRDADGANSCTEFYKSIRYLDKAYGHFKLKIPYDWQPRNEYWSSSEDGDDYKVLEEEEHLASTVVSPP
jgi:hypothetical protein